MSHEPTHRRSLPFMEQLAAATWQLAAATVIAPPAATAPTSEQPQKGVFTAALNTHHDAVLAEIHGHSGWP
jgi:hypothetical protein